MVAYLRGVRDYNDALKRPDGRSEVGAVLAQYTAVQDISLYRRTGFVYLDPNGRLNAASLAEQLAWFTQQGLVTAPVDLQAAQDSSFVDSALQRLGRYE